MRRPFFVCIPRQLFRRRRRRSPTWPPTSSSSARTAGSRARCSTTGRRCMSIRSSTPSMPSIRAARFTGFESNFLFGNNFRRASNHVLTAEDLALYGAMSTYWRQFADTGDPNPPGVPVPWPPIESDLDGRPVDPAQADRHLRVRRKASSRTATSETRSATSGSRSTFVQCWELSRRQRGNCRRLATVQDGAVEQSAGVANPRVRRRHIGNLSKRRWGLAIK